MTREEAIAELKILKENYWDDDGYGHETEQYNDTMLALDMAIEALEQEPKSEWEHDHEILKAYSNGANEVLDKIRAEIEKYRDSMRWNSESLVKWEAVNYVLEHIIDKYKAESEANNGNND